eukprot:5105151-Amphidinium_carterae.1
MLQNLPQRATQKTLLAELESAGYSDMFDFCYVPIVFQTGPAVQSCSCLIRTKPCTTATAPEAPQNKNIKELT